MKKLITLFLIGIAGIILFMVVKNMANGDGLLPAVQPKIRSRLNSTQRQRISSQLRRMTVRIST